MNTVTVTRRNKSKYTVEFSELPGRKFGPWELIDTIQDLTVSAMMSPLDARNLVLDAAADGSATTSY